MCFILQRHNHAFLFPLTCRIATLTYLVRFCVTEIKKSLEEHSFKNVVTPFAKQILYNKE